MAQNYSEGNAARVSNPTGCRKFAKLAASSALALSLFAPGVALAQEAQEEETDDTIVVVGNLNALPVDDVGSVFGFDRNLVETPRSASTVSSEQLDRFGITDIYGLVAQAPGTFTNSFFGVGGALDIRGTPGETYFRGVRRLDNAGNYPTPIAAADRIDIVRGPASPISGPSKTGGYVNFVPKTARVGSGFRRDISGDVRITAGSWDKGVISASLIGPIDLGDTKAGFAIYAEIEDSGSYYRNIHTDQKILQGSFDFDVGTNARVEFGGMYHQFDGVQNGGWNRLTQDLIDNGTYITGQAQVLDQDGDGQLSRPEFRSAGTFNPFGTFGCPAGSTPATSDGGFGSVFAADFTDACLAEAFPQLALENTGTTTLSRRNSLAGPDDLLENEAILLYADFIWESDAGFEIKNQLFYDATDNLNENDYGFSQFVDSWVVENKLIFSNSYTTEYGKFSFQLSPSIRHTDFQQGDDFDLEFFHRVDLVQDYDARSNRLLSTESGGDFDNFNVGEYTNYAMAGLVDLDFDFGLSVILGGRYDWIDVESTNLGEFTEDGVTSTASGSDGAFSYSGSIAYELPFGFIPYVTYAEQSTLIAGQGAEVGVDQIEGGTFLSASQLFEYGIKGSFFDDRLYAALSIYEQERVDFNAQSIVTNQAVRTEGLEAEIRWAVTDDLLITGAYTNTKVVNLTALENGTLFSFFGIEDLVNVTDPTLHLGGQPIGLVPIPDEDAARRAGIPENLFSATATYEFPFGLALSGSLVVVEEVFSGQSQAVRLPGYELVDLSASYQAGPWLFRGVLKNATDARYFRANFTELFGSTIVLPELPRSFQASVIYSF